MAERGHSLESIKASIEARKPDFDAYIGNQLILYLEIILQLFLKAKSILRISFSMKLMGHIIDSNKKKLIKTCYKTPTSGIQKKKKLTPNNSLSS